MAAEITFSDRKCLWGSILFNTSVNWVEISLIFPVGVDNCNKLFTELKKLSWKCACVSRSNEMLLEISQISLPNLRNETQKKLKRRLKKINIKQHFGNNMEFGCWGIYSIYCVFFFKVKLKNSDIQDNTYQSEQRHTSKCASWLRTNFLQPWIV